MSLIAVYTTVASLDEAQQMARALVEQNLVACVQIDKIESCYRWDGKVQLSPEYRLMCKSTTILYPHIEAAIRAIHAYELPAIYAQPVTQAFAQYAHWVESSTLSKAGEPDDSAS